MRQSDVRLSYAFSLSLGDSFRDARPTFALFVCLADRLRVQILQQVHPMNSACLIGLGCIGVLPVIGLINCSSRALGESAIP